MATAALPVNTPLDLDYVKQFLDERMHEFRDAIQAADAIMRQASVRQLASHAEAISLGVRTVAEFNERRSVQ